MGLAHFLGLLIGVQNQAKMGILRRNDRVQKPGKEFGLKTAFLDGLVLTAQSVGLIEDAYNGKREMQVSFRILYLARHSRQYRTGGRLTPVLKRLTFLKYFKINML